MADLQARYDALKSQPTTLSWEAADFMVSGGRNPDGSTTGFASNVDFKLTLRTPRSIMD